MILLLLTVLHVASPPALVATQAPAPHYRTIVTGKSAPPVPWTLVSTATVEGDRAAKIGRSLGGEVASLTNAVFSLSGETLQVNVVDCPTVQDAGKVQLAVLATHGGNRAWALLDGATVIEFTRARLPTILRAHYDLGFKPKTATYRVKFEAAPMSRGDYMAWNKLYNSFLELARASSKEEVTARIASESRDFTFGGPIRLRTHGLGNEESRFTFAPVAQRTESDADGEILASSFESLPTRAGIPSVAVTAEVICTAFALTQSTRKSDPSLIAATEFWPSADPEVAKLTQEIVGDRQTAREKTEAILAWLTPGANIRYAGEIVGSRYGVKQVLSQRFGHCWDFSDCCVTLCRAAGVPARQVAGWLYQQSGHVWTEVLLEGEGWWQIDPTAGAPCWADHIPYAISEDGHWSFLYTSPVDIERVEPSKPR